MRVVLHLRQVENAKLLTTARRKSVARSCSAMVHTHNFVIRAKDSTEL